MNGENSILDKVISSYKTKEKEHFYPAELVSTLLKYLSGKEEDILRRRFGLNRTNRETLEEIGHSYNVTRERIRQIENNSVIKTRSIKNYHQLIDPIEHLFTTILTENGGFMSEDKILENLVGYSDEKEMDNRAILFLLKVILRDKYRYLDDKFLRPAWSLKHASLDLLKKVIEELVNLLKVNGKPLTKDQIYQKFIETEIYRLNKTNLTDGSVASFLHIAREIDKNPYDEFGLASWGSITPKRINDKIHLVLKKKGKPMHFMEIAEEINNIKFDKRKAYPPTIHNELIMNNQYVLVGRGIYALSEWGYKPGVVADVLRDIIKKENRPMTREELVKKVLEKRMVKKNTIHLALTDKSIFQKLADGRYSLAEKK